MKLWQTSAKHSSSLVEEYLAGDDIKLDLKLLPYELYGSMAHAMGLQKIGIFSTDEVAKIKCTLSKLLDSEFTISPADEDIHTAIENLLVDSLGATGEKIHTGRSRNDQVLVDLRLFAKDHLQQIALQTSSLMETLLELAKEHEFTPMPGMTHTRFAMPSSIGLWASSFAEGLFESLCVLDAAYGLVDKSPLGSSAGYGVPLDLDRDSAADLLGFSGVQINSLNATSSRPRFDYAVISSLAQLMFELGRLATDLIWGSSEGFGYFKLPAEFCTGSSIMPNKSNPDVLEILRAKAAQISGSAVQTMLIGQNKISGYHRDHQALKPLLIGSLETTLSSLQVILPLMEGIEIDVEMLEGSITSEMFAVDALMQEVKSGTPLRQAYRKVKENLDSIEIPDIEEALKARSHIGGPGNLKLGDLESKVDSLKLVYGERRKLFLDKLNQLLPIKS